MTTYKNYNLENNLKKITQTYDFNGNIIDTDFLYFNYNNAYEKSSKRINIIINQINNKKNGIIKKYQVRGYYEYKIIKKYCIENNINHDLIIDENILTNKVINIKQYIIDYDHENNLQKLIVENEKIPTDQSSSCYLPF